MEGTSDDEVKWDLQSSGDEGGTATEAPAQVQAKPKKARSKGQLAAFESMGVNPIGGGPTPGEKAANFPQPI